MSLSARAAEIFAAQAKALANPNVPSLRALRRSLSRELRHEPAELVLEIAGRLARIPSLRWTAYELIRCHPGAFAALDEALVDAFAVDLDSWESVDAFARTLSGPAWVHGGIGDALIERWARSSDRWLRRAALVSTVALNRPAEGGSVDTPRTLWVCRRLIADRDDMVVKALSWALRELGRQEPDSVATFLASHEAELAARVKREVGNKLRTGLKSPRRAG
jgi:3-methyladenine DNA glycosylase AlkD